MILTENEAIARIFFSSFVFGNGGGFSVAPSLLDEKVFSVRGVMLSAVEADRAKFVGLVFGLVAGLLLLL